MINSPLHGVIPIVPTPFLPDGDLDLNGLRRVVDYLVDAGVDGIAVLGMASESYALTDAEREVVIDTAAARLDRRLPLVVGCSHNSGTAVAQLAIAAHKSGADTLMIMPPAIGDPAQSVIRGYYSDAAAATDLPIMVQDNPSWTGVSLPVETYRWLCELETVQYAKIETSHPPTKIDEVRSAIGDRLALFGGQAGAWLPEEMTRGTAGTMPAAIMPQVYLTVWRLWASGERARALAIFDRYHPMIRVSSVPGVGIPMAKALFARLGLIASDHVRGPLTPLSRSDRNDLDRVVADLDLLSVMAGAVAPNERR